VSRLGVARELAALRCGAAGGGVRIESRATPRHGPTHSAGVRGDPLRLRVGVLERSGEAGAQVVTMERFAPHPTSPWCDMAQLTSLLMAGLVCHPLWVDDPRMQEPKPPVTEFDGVWHERVPPGTRDELKATVTFAWEQVTINLHGQELRGTFTTSTGKGA